MWRILTMSLHTLLDPHINKWFSQCALEELDWRKALTSTPIEHLRDNFHRARTYYPTLIPDLTDAPVAEQEHITASSSPICCANKSQRSGGCCSSINTNGIGEEISYSMRVMLRHVLEVDVLYFFNSEGNSDGLKKPQRAGEPPPLWCTTVVTSSPHHHH